MREIKFRAVIGYEDKLQVRKDIQSIDFDDDGHVIFINDVMFCVGEDAILEQYTGLKDANGVEIYEGDYIAFRFSTKDANFLYQGVVVFDEFMFVVDVPNGDRFSLNRINSVNIIGNIHENPELLK